MICEHCGKEFDGRKKKYCSDECRENHFLQARRHYKDFKCANCGKEFKSCANAKFCSAKCRLQYYYKNSKKTIWYDKICIICGKPFRTTLPNKKCCSNQCAFIRYKQKQQKNYQNKKEKIQIMEKSGVTVNTTPQNTSCCFICGKDIPLGKTIHRECLSKTTLDIEEDCIY